MHACISESWLRLSLQTVTGRHSAGNTPSRSPNGQNPHQSGEMNWITSFEIPPFSRHCMEELDSPKPTTKATRQEINAMLSSMMWTKTMYPTPYEYTEVCRKLITKYPKLRDSTGSGIVSHKAYAYHSYIISVYSALHKPQNHVMALQLHRSARCNHTLY